MNDECKIRVGPAGWHYQDWYGNVYPEDAPKNFKELEYIAEYFNTVEINSSFYAPPNSFASKAWVRKIAHNPDFKFTAKLWQRFTHQLSPFSTRDVKNFSEGIDPLYQSGKFGAMLCQFPWRFKNTEENRTWLLRIFEAFRHLPLVVEIRHASWDTPPFFDFLKKHRVGIACIDQPVIGKSIGLMDHATGDIGYVRLHGRNYSTWFNKKAQAASYNGSARYDYLYNAKEIAEITNSVQNIMQTTRETYVVQNNHPRGQAAVTSFQMKISLGERDLKIPESLIRSYPQLLTLLPDK